MSNYPSLNYWNNINSNLNNSLMTSRFTKEPTYSLHSSVEYPKLYPITSPSQMNTLSSSTNLLNQNCSCGPELQKLRNQLTATTSQLNDKIDSLSKGNLSTLAKSSDVIPYTDMLIKINEMQTHINDLSSKVGSSSAIVDSLNNRMGNVEQQQQSAMNSINNITNLSNPVTKNDVEIMINSKLSPIENKLNTLLSKVSEIDKHQTDLNEALKEIGALARKNSDRLQFLEIKCGSNSNMINETSIRVDSLYPSKAEKNDFIDFKNKQEKLNVNYQSNIRNLHQASDQLEEKIELVNQMGMKNARIAQNNFDAIDDKINENVLYNYTQEESNVEALKNDFERLTRDLEEWKEQIETRVSTIIGETINRKERVNNNRESNYSGQDHYDIIYPAQLSSTNMFSNRKTDTSENALMINNLNKRFAQKDDLETLRHSIYQLESRINSMNDQM